MEERSFGRFMRDVLGLSQSVAPIIGWRVALAGGVALAVVAADLALTSLANRTLAVEIGLHEVAGATLAFLLIIRTNAGYDRWWEGRKLWGSIVNQCRNIAISGIAYGPSDREWRRQLAFWTAVFPYAARWSLRVPDKVRWPCNNMERLLGSVEYGKLMSATHIPSYVAARIADLLRSACERGGMDKFSFIQVDRERAALIEHIGACERIRTTPLPLSYAIKIRRFVFIFVVTLPFALLDKTSNYFLVVAITVLVAHLLFALDQIGAELQDPFNYRALDHLHLRAICTTIENAVLANLAPEERLPMLGGEASQSSVPPKSPVSPFDEFQFVSPGPTTQDPTLTGRSESISQ